MLATCPFSADLWHLSNTTSYDSSETCVSLEIALEPIDWARADGAGNEVGNERAGTQDEVLSWLDWDARICLATAGKFHGLDRTRGQQQVPGGQQQVPFIVVPVTPARAMRVTCKARRTQAVVC